MASWTPPTTLPVGAPLPSTAFNNLANDTLFLYQRPFASFSDGTGTPVGSGGDTIVQLGGTSFNNYGVSLINGNTAILPLAGVWQFNFRVGFGTALAGGGWAILFHNGTSTIFGSWTSLFASTADGFAQSTGSGILPCNAGDQVFLACFQNSGGDVNCQAGSGQTALEMYFVGSL